ncbi:MAG: metal ABC transporter permease [Spirochaetaceae bacterium]|nr:MAG: metal ABC transporter permease [Spirochaetaceae bacterium]
MNLILSIILIAVVTAVACAIPGTFLVLRRMSMVTEGVSHSILPGLVLAMMIFGTQRAPILVLGPALMGLALVVLVEAIHRTDLLAGDAPLGVIFPALFSIGVIIISRRYAGIPLSENSVLIGDINLAALTQLRVGDTAIGPRTLYVMSAILVANVLFTVALFKELKVTTFDPGLASSVGIRPAIVHYAFMALVSITIVGAFEAVGAILVVGLLIAPAATAYLLCRTLRGMLITSAVFATVSALLGFALAYVLDSATSATMAMMMGLFFLLALVFAPRTGLVARLHTRRRRRIDFATTLLVLHLIHHAEGERNAPACTAEGVMQHINWAPEFAGEVIQRAVAEGVITEHHNVLMPTLRGRSRCRSVMPWEGCEDPSIDQPAVTSEENQ